MPPVARKTTPVAASKPTSNRARRRKLLEEFDKLLTILARPEFHGRIEIEVSAKDGQLGEGLFSMRRYGAAPAD